MKTLTEFAGIYIKKAAQTKQELTTAGKTSEELPAAMGEALKLEGDRLNFLLNALEVVGTHLNDLKRVIVLSLNEGEKGPQHSVQKGEHAYLSEYYPSLDKKRPEKELKGAPGQDQKKGKGKRGKGKGGRGPRRGPPRGPGSEQKTGEIKPRSAAPQNGEKPQIIPVSKA